MAGAVRLKSGAALALAAVRPGRGRGPNSQTVRYGAQFTPAVVDMRREAKLDLLSACGIPVSMASTSQPGSAREGLREFLHASVQPLAELIALELADKLDLFGLSFGFDRLFAADIQTALEGLQVADRGGFELVRRGTPYRVSGAGGGLTWPRLSRTRTSPSVRPPTRQRSPTRTG